jgi:hypothetical protein
MSEYQRAGLGGSLFGEETYRSPTALAITATIGIVLACAMDVVTTSINWTQYNVVTDYFDGQAQDADLTAADDLARSWTIPYLAIVIAAGIAFLIWWRRAHHNARWFGGPESQGRSGGWVIGAWFCPIVNFWYPCQMVADAWRASAPRPARAGIVILWWLLYLPSGLISFYANRTAAAGGTPASPSAFRDSLHTVAVANTIATGLYLAAGGAIIFIIVQLTRWQTTPRDPDGPAIDTAG